MHFTLPHYHHFADASVGIELLKYLSGSFCRVSKIKSILSILFHSIHAALSSQLTHFSYDDCENMCTLSHFHHQIGIMTHCHCLGLGHEKWHALYVFLYSYVSCAKLYDILTR